MSRRPACLAVPLSLAPQESTGRKQHGVGRTRFSSPRPAVNAALLGIIDGMVAYYHAYAGRSIVACLHVQSCLITCVDFLVSLARICEVDGTEERAAPPPGLKWPLPFFTCWCCLLVVGVVAVRAGRDWPVSSRRGGGGGVPCYFLGWSSEFRV